MDYEVSLPHEVEAEMGRAPVAYLPWGAHEWHGLHNPLGVDGLKARFLAERLCEETGGVVFPAVYCGHSTLKTVLDPGFPLSLDFGADTIAVLARDYLSELASIGFRAIVIVLGHWGAAQGQIVRAEVSAFNARQSAARAWAVQEDDMLRDLGFGDDHGGVEETSFMMACCPGRVDLSRLPAGRPLSFAEDGVLGRDPRDGSSAEHGMERVRVYVERAARYVRGMLSSVEDKRE